MSNFKNVLKVFKAMRDFDPDDHALLNTLRNATEADIELLIEAVGPVKRATKKATTKTTSKSRRRAGISDAIKGTARAAGKVADDFDDRKCLTCPMAADDNVHHLRNDPNYHEFIAASAKADDYQEQAAGAGD